MKKKYKTEPAISVQIASNFKGVWGRIEASVDGSAWATDGFINVDEGAIFNIRLRNPESFKCYRIYFEVPDET